MENEKKTSEIYPLETPLPYYAEEFLIYMETIKGKSPNTVREYRYDLLMFFGYFSRKNKLDGPELLDEDFIKGLRLGDLFQYANYLDKERKQKPTTRARKISSVKSMFRYLHTKMHLIEQNPALDLETPKLAKRNPIYLELDESKQLLSSVDGENEERDYCILTLFLNCGLRLSELCSINLSSIKDNHLTVVGKGSKERTVYLNNACESALAAYRKVRPALPENDPDKDALFLSERKKRISTKTVQYAVRKYLMKCGLDTEKYSPHKLRHTAATLMYKYGQVDIRSLQEILGHESIATTQIYTHVDNGMLADAVRENPLANEKKD